MLFSLLKQSLDSDPVATLTLLIAFAGAAIALMRYIRKHSGRTGFNQLLCAIASYALLLEAVPVVWGNMPQFQPTDPKEERIALLTVFSVTLAVTILLGIFMYLMAMSRKFYRRVFRWDRRFSAKYYNRFGDTGFELIDY